MSWMRWRRSLDRPTSSGLEVGSEAASREADTARQRSERDLIRRITRIMISRSALCAGAGAASGDVRRSARPNDLRPNGRHRNVLHCCARLRSALLGRNAETRNVVRRRGVLKNASPRIVGRRNAGWTDAGSRSCEPFRAKGRRAAQVPRILDSDCSRIAAERESGSSGAVQRTHGDSGRQNSTQANGSFAPANGSSDSARSRGNSGP